VDSDDLRKFQERGQCVVKQFDNYYIEPTFITMEARAEGRRSAISRREDAHLAFNKSLAGKPPAAGH